MIHIIRRRALHFSSALIFGLSLLLTNIPIKVGATSSSAWFSANSPTVTQLASGMASIPSRAEGQPCQNMSIKTKKRTLFSNSETWSSQCAMIEPYGFETASSYLQIGDVAGPLKDANFSNALIPIPNSNNILSMSTNASGNMFLSFNYNYTTHLTATSGGSPLTPDGTISYQINTLPQDTIKDTDGHTLALNYNSMNFSSNGKYLVADAPGISLLRIDLQTHAVLPFGNPFYYYSGISNGGKLSISDDGRMVVATSQYGSRFQIYDLDTCGSAPSTITRPVSCDTKDLWSTWSSSSAGSYLPANLSFTDDDTLFGYTHPSSATGYIQYAMTSYGHGITTQQYLALGDSFSSGEGGT